MDNINTTGYIRLRKDNYAHKKSIELYKVGKDMYNIRILTQESKKIFYILDISLDYGRFKLGLRNFFKKTKIKANKDKNMIELYNIFKSIVTHHGYEMGHLDFLEDYIYQTYGTITGIEISRVHIHRLINEVKVEHKFDTLSHIAYYLENCTGRF